jgi:hypothetical protein
MIIKRFKISFLVFCLSLSLISTCFADFTCKMGRVERAGVALIKRYPRSNPDLEYTVLMGIDAQRTKSVSTTLPNGRFLNKSIPHVNFFAGKCHDQQPKCRYSTEVAALELKEETGGAVRLSASAIQKMSYVYSGDFSKKTPQKNYIQLFFYRNDNLSVNHITAAQTKACQQLNRPHAQREVRATVAIPLQAHLNRAREIAALERANRVQEAAEEKWYIFQTRGNGYGQDQKWVFLDPQYVRNLARDLGHFERICAQLSNGRVR